MSAPTLHRDTRRFPRAFYALITGAMAGGLVTLLIVLYLISGFLQQAHRLNQVTTLAGQYQSAAGASGAALPDPKEVASGKVDAPSTKQYPTAGAGESEPVPTANQIVAMVLARIPKPKDGKDGKSPSSDTLQKAIVATLAAHPDLTQHQVSTAVASYLQSNPPESGKNGVTPACELNPAHCVGASGENGTNGADGMNGDDGDSVTGAHVCQPADSFGPDSTPYCTGAAAVGDLVIQTTHTNADGTTAVAYHDAGPAPRGLKGDQGPGPTADQIGDAVSSYMAAHPVDACKDGYSPNDVNVEESDGSTVVVRACTKDGSEEPPPSVLPPPSELPTVASSTP